MGDDAFGQLTDSADPAMIVVTTAVEGERAGCLVGFHSQSSITPAGYCIWLSKANHTYRTALRARHLAVHFLTADDVPLAERFGTLTGDQTDKFAGLDLDLPPGHERYDVPLLAACPRRMVLERVALLDDGSDHVCLTTRVVRAESAGTFRPLRLSMVADLPPGHDSEERAIEP